MILFLMMASENESWDECSLALLILHIIWSKTQMIKVWKKNVKFTLRYLPHQKRALELQIPLQYLLKSFECHDSWVLPNQVECHHVLGPKASLWHLGFATIPPIDVHPKNLKKGIDVNEHSMYTLKFEKRAKLHSFSTIIELFSKVVAYRTKGVKKTLQSVDFCLRST